jgi:hypothetical protein
MHMGLQFQGRNAFGAATLSSLEKPGEKYARDSLSSSSIFVASNIKISL